MEKFLKYLLLVPKRIHNAFLCLKEKFKQGDWATKLKAIALLAIGFLILVPLAAFGFMIVLTFITLSLIISLFTPRRDFYQ